MNGQDEHRGRCLCGAVEIVIKPPSMSVGTCHCNMCRKWAGGPQFMVDCGDGTRFEGEEHITIYESSSWAVRGFCKGCGTHLFYRLKDGAVHYFVPIGLFDSTLPWVFDHEIFIDEKPGFYDFANATQKLTGEQAFAQIPPTTP